MDIITLLETLMNGLLDAEDKFLSNPTDFYSLEASVKSTTESFAAGFLGCILSSVNQQICKNGWRKGKYKIQRTDRRTLISSVGDVSFDCTYFESIAQPGSYRYLLEDFLSLGRHERFTVGGEVALLSEALKTSYEEATLAIPSHSKITRTTVMNKVHQLAEFIPIPQAEKKKQVPYLFIEADEDHVAEQHGRWNNKSANGSFISRLVYVYEYKKESSESKGRKELVNTHYFGGLYEGTKGIEKLWNEVASFIGENYDFDTLEKVYISGDGANWIQKGTEYIEKSVYCIDRFHLMKYINSASNQMMDEGCIAKAEIYRLLYGQHKKEFKQYTQAMLNSANNPESIEILRRYVINNWSAIMRTLHDKEFCGCSAEGHVSHVLSERLSSRPKGWSQTGADRMSRLRCYEKNYGRDSIVELVKYSREQRELKRTGTDDCAMNYKEFSMADIKEKHNNQARVYFDRIQASVPGVTVRKIASIRTRLTNL